MKTYKNKVQEESMDSKPTWWASEIYINNVFMCSSIIYSNVQGFGSLISHLGVWWEILTVSYSL